MSPPPRRARVRSGDAAGAQHGASGAPGSSAAPPVRARSTGVEPAPNGTAAARLLGPGGPGARAPAGEAGRRIGLLVEEPAAGARVVDKGGLVFAQEGVGEDDDDAAGLDSLFQGEEGGAKGARACGGAASGASSEDQQLAVGLIKIGGGSDGSSSDDGCSVDGFDDHVENPGAESGLAVLFEEEDDGDDTLGGGPGLAAPAPALAQFGLAELFEEEEEDGEEGRGVAGEDGEDGLEGVHGHGGPRSHDSAPEAKIRESSDAGGSSSYTDETDSVSDDDDGGRRGRVVTFAVVLGMGALLAYGAALPPSLADGLADMCQANACTPWGATSTATAQPRPVVGLLPGREITSPASVAGAFPHVVSDAADWADQHHRGGTGTSIASAPSSSFYSRPPDVQLPLSLLIASMTLGMIIAINWCLN
ncbi:unnamed protein product [Urochloa humidicola]